MMLVLAGLHGSGKSYFSSHIAAEFGWDVCVKRDLLKLLHGREGVGGDWVKWYRELYASKGLREVTRLLLDLAPPSSRIIMDSVHNLAEWKAVKELRPDSVLAYVIAPKAVRVARNGQEDEILDIRRVSFWHEGGHCLAVESEWCFNGAATTEVQKEEFKAFLIHYSVR